MSEIERRRVRLALAIVALRRFFYDYFPRILVRLAADKVAIRA